MFDGVVVTILSCSLTPASPSLYLVGTAAVNLGCDCMVESRVRRAARDRFSAPLLLLLLLLSLLSLLPLLPLATVMVPRKKRQSATRSEESMDDERLRMSNDTQDVL